MSPRLRVLPLGTLALLLLAGCSADPLSVLILNARAPGDKCDFTDATLYSERGSLDLRPYLVGGAPVVSNTYGQVFSWENQLQPNPISVNGQIVDPGGGNDFIGDTIVYEYQYTDPSVALASETQNVRAVIQAGGDPTKNSVGAQLIQPNAFAAINASALGAAGQTLLVTFQMFGKLAAGTSKHTNKVSFPLTVYRSSTTPADCAALGQIPNGGACGVPGRDQIVSCKTP